MMQRALTADDVNMAGYVNLPGSTSTSESFRVALQFAKAPLDADERSNLRSTLFVICIHNYGGFNGFRMDSALFSAHPGEREDLLIEGAPMAVLGVEEIYVDNAWTNDPFWTSFNNKHLNVIYLFNAQDLNPVFIEKKE